MTYFSIFVIGFLVGAVLQLVLGAEDLDREHRE
jgi:hypothetical protein